MPADFLALLLSFAAVYFQSRPAGPSQDLRLSAGRSAGRLHQRGNADRHFDLDRHRSHPRLYAPVAVQPRLMMIVAAAGVVMNGVIAALLWGVARDVNLRSAFLHMAGDTLSTAAVIAGGAGILLTGHNWIDPALSLRHCRADSLDQPGHRPREPQHSPRRHAPRRLARRDSRRHAVR